MIFHVVYHKFKPRYTLPNKAIVLKHHEKNLYCKFYKPVGTSCLLDLDLKIKSEWFVHKLTLHYFEVHKQIC